MTVVILGDPEDAHALHIYEQLRNRSVETVFMDSLWFPRDLRIWFDPNSGDGAFNFPDGRNVKFSEIHSIYWRNYNGVAGPELPDPEQAYIAENDSRSLFESIFLSIEAKWVNSFEAFRFHQTKGAQLATVAKLGVQIPATLLTNEPQSVSDFTQYHPDAIFKPVQGGAHTRKFTPQMAQPESLRRLALAPITLQREIPGTNIRVFLIGDEVIACEVRTNAEDFRDDDASEILPHDLPEVIQNQCRKIAKALFLKWSGMDFRLTPEGEYVFLEANPSPMFLGFEEALALPITEKLISYLTS